MRCTFPLLIVIGLVPSSVATPVRAEVRAELVRVDQQAEVEAAAGELGRIGIPRSGFCTYVYKTDGGVTINDSSGQYEDGGPTPDGCSAPNTSQPPTFVLTCAPGQTVRFRLNAKAARKGVELTTEDVSVMGGRIEGGAPDFELTCESETGQVRLTTHLGVALTVEAETGEGDLGSVDLETGYE
jgi:hypothetical protein